MCMLQSVLEVMFTTYRACARGRPAEEGEDSWLWTGFSSIVKLEPYIMLKAYLGKKLKDTFESPLGVAGDMFCWVFSEASLLLLLARKLGALCRRTCLSGQMERSCLPDRTTHLDQPAWQTPDTWRRRHSCGGRDGIHRSGTESPGHGSGSFLQLAPWKLQLG